AEPKKELDAALQVFKEDAKAFESRSQKLAIVDAKATAQTQVKATTGLTPLADQTKDLAKQADHLLKLLNRLLDVCEKELNARESADWNSRDITRARKSCDEARHVVVEQLRQTRYFHRHAAWLTERFPDAKLVDVPGLVKLISRNEIENKDWSL